ncbi:hypothetical protein HPB50_001908 [Hyalomma asiaticum]|uniref:Uncharacterized protein n=1 Tax=Hyalomma asiaticum TaxID=266040 RepID=A0ACB7TFD9_HYAAI|nr:hypothetical protein HPB50_001908 [Hyalomma asiaticum]
MTPRLSRNTARRQGGWQLRRQDRGSNEWTPPEGQVVETEERGGRAQRKPATRTHEKGRWCSRARGPAGEEIAPLFSAEAFQEQVEGPTDRAAAAVPVCKPSANARALVCAANCLGRLLQVPFGRLLPTDRETRHRSPALLRRTSSTASRWLLRETTARAGAPDSVPSVLGGGRGLQTPNDTWRNPDRRKVYAREQ